MKTAGLCLKHLDGSSWLIVLVFFLSDRSKMMPWTVQLLRVLYFMAQESMIQCIEALKNLTISVPQAVRRFDTATLLCNYDLEGELLYTVKWYKGTKEFFRFVPKELPSTLVFHIPGINVDLSKSGPNEIVLIDVQPEVTGRYLCEVSTDSPNFYTRMESSFMYIVDVPNENPIMEISKHYLKHGIYKLVANCTTPPSFPAMNVTWYINGLKVNEVLSKKISLNPEKKLLRSARIPYMTVSYMEREIDENVYQDEVVKIQCIATIFNLYRSENLRYIEDNRPQPWPSSVIGVTENIAGTIKIPRGREILVLLIFCILR